MSLRILQQLAVCTFAVVAVLCMAFGITSQALAANTISSAYFVDADFDGTVDHAEFIFDENIDQCTYEAGDWSINTAGTIGITAITGIDTSGVETPGEGTCDGSDGRVYLNVTTTANVTGGATAPTITYTNQGTLGSLSGVTTAQISTQGSALTDWTAPAVVLTNPADGSASHSPTQDLIITFSEPMDTTFVEDTEFDISPDPGAFTAEWSAGNTILTLNGPAFACTTAYTITTDNTAINASAGSSTGLVTTGPEDGDWSFTTRGCSGSSIIDSSTSAAIELTAPTESAAFAAGSTQTIAWNTVSSGGFVNIWFSSNNGSTYTKIANQIEDSGQYAWTVPAQATTEGLIRIDMTDLAITLASDTSGSFTITSTPPATGGAEQPAESPVTETDEVVINGVQPRTYIVGTTFSAVYYIDDQMIRHPFFNEHIYFTWQTDFTAVQRVPDATLALMPMGRPMLPKPGTKLVKIESDPSVYAVDTNPENEFSPLLRKIDSEAMATQLFGSHWASLVLDIPVTLFTKYTLGANLTTTP
ncbi:MAG: Ig-like domain-containing protein [Patescibacteria group bacterium]